MIYFHTAINHFVMRTITSFTFLTINGYYKGLNEDISWHIHGGEGTKMSEDQLEADNILLFGRRTYEMMAGFWPTEMAYQLYPEVAAGMNRAEKIVLSNSLQTADWSPTTILSGNTIEQIRELKSLPGKNITILGSGSVLRQLSDAQLIDQYELLIDPIAIGQGTPLLQDLQHQLQLQLKDCQVFKESGSVFLTYQKV